MILVALIDLMGTVLTGHSFQALLYWKRNDTSGTMTNAKALAIAEDIAGRALTAGEQQGLLDVVADMEPRVEAADPYVYTQQDLQHAQSLRETGHFNNAEVKAVLGIT